MIALTVAFPNRAPDPSKTGVKILDKTRIWNKSSRMFANTKNRLDLIRSRARKSKRENDEGVLIENRLEAQVASSEPLVVIGGTSATMIELTGSECYTDNSAEVRCYRFRLDVIYRGCVKKIDKTFSDNFKRKVIYRELNCRWYNLQ